MRADAHQNIKPTHLKRTAYLYIRQSTLRQVFENIESTKRQFDGFQRQILGSRSLSFRLTGTA